MRYILDNISMQIETIEWCKLSHHELISLKLDFKKVYDIVNLEFLFLLMLKLGNPQAFVEVVKILFEGVEVSVPIDGAEPGSLSIKRGIRQGCPLAPYLFLFVGQAFNSYTKHQKARAHYKVSIFLTEKGNTLVEKLSFETMSNVTRNVTYWSKVT